MREKTGGTRDVRIGKVLSEGSIVLTVGEKYIQYAFE